MSIIPSTVPRTMQAAFLVRQNAPLVVDEVALPPELEVGQVLVQVRLSGICGSQLGEIDGVKGADVYLPHMLGHEGSGIVIAIGAGVRHVRPDDHVVMHWRRGAGIEAEPAVYTWRGQRLNAGRITTFSQYAIVSENRLTPIPRDFDPELAVLFGCAATTGLGVVTNDARLLPGESLLVLGVGGVGLCVVQGAFLVSANPIIAVDRHPKKCQLARHLGATHVVAADAIEAIRTAVHEWLGREGADVVVETTGSGAMIALACELTATEGRTVLVGVPRHDEIVSLDTLPLHFGKSLKGSHGGACQPDKDIPRYIRLCAAGKLALGQLITNRYKLEEINVAIERLRVGDVVGRCLLTMMSNS